MTNTKASVKRFSEKSAVNFKNNEVKPEPNQVVVQKPILIEGVKTRVLKPIADERGRLTELFRSDWPEFVRFGQTYLTTAYPGVTKGWHYHNRQVDNFICIHGMIKLVLYDARVGSKTYGVINEFFIGDNNLILVQIPAIVYHGFKCISIHEALLLNIPTDVYDYTKPDEYRLPAHTRKIPYDWARKDG